MRPSGCTCSAAISRSRATASRRAAAALDQCALLRPVPVVIEAGATANDPDSITVFFGGSRSLSTPVPFMQNSGVNAYVVQGPVGFSANADPKKTDVVAAVQGATCTVSTIDAGGVAVDPATGFATLTVTPVAGNLGATYSAVTASLVNLGPAESMGRIAYTVDASTHALRTQKLLPNADPVAPLVSDVVNLKAQYGLDTDNDGIVDTWQDADRRRWSAASLPAQPLATLRQIRAVRVAIVTRSAQYEKDPVTAGPIVMFDNEPRRSHASDDDAQRRRHALSVQGPRNRHSAPQRALESVMSLHVRFVPSQPFARCAAHAASAASCCSSRCSSWWR